MKNRMNPEIILQKEKYKELKNMVLICEAMDEYASPFQTEIEGLCMHLESMNKRWNDENNERIKLKGRYDAQSEELKRLREENERLKMEIGGNFTD